MAFAVTHHDSEFLIFNSRALQKILFLRVHTHAIALAGRDSNDARLSKRLVDALFTLLEIEAKIVLSGKLEQN